MLKKTLLLLITFQVPKGDHKVQVVFTESPVRLLSDIISLVGWIVLVVWFAI